LSRKIPARSPNEGTIFENANLPLVYDNGLCAWQA